MATYTEWLARAVAPGFYQKKWGLKYMQTAGFALDLMSNAARAAAKIRYPSTCPDDALGYVGEARNIPRYRRESAASYREVVANAWEVWEKAGTKRAISDAVVRLGYTAPLILGWHEASLLAPGPPAPYENWWTAFWVVITPNPYGTRSWGDAGLTWGGTVSSPIGNPDAVATWGSTANALDVAEIRSAVRKWKPSHEICAHIILRANTGVDVFDPANVYWGAR